MKLFVKKFRCEPYSPRESGVVKIFTRPFMKHEVGTEEYWQLSGLNYKKPKRIIIIVPNKTTERDALERKYKDKIVVNPHLSRKLVSFQANKATPIYNWFKFKEGFSSEMVRLFVNEFKVKPKNVLDPFSGSGTTILTARNLGIPSIGIEMMPIGQFVLESKLAAERVDLSQLAKTFELLKNVDFSKVEKDKNFKHVSITSGAFPEETERRLNGFLSYISKNVKDEDIRKVLLFACFCILESISYTRKDGQYLRWDSRSGRTKTNFNKGRIYKFEEALFGQIKTILDDLRTPLYFYEKNENPTDVKIIQGSCLEIMPSLEGEQFDLVITSPPYCNRYDYTRTYALELAFLGVDSNGIKQLRQNLLSATVENKEKQDFLLSVYSKNKQEKLLKLAEEAFESTSALQEVLEILDEYKKQKKLNNPGIYRMVKNYFYEHSFVIFELSRLLRKGGRIYYVDDNVRYAGETIPVDFILSEFAKKAGLNVKNIYVLQNGKGNSSQQMGVHGREELRKSVCVWEK